MTGIGRGCRSGRWRRGTGCIGGRSGRRWSRRSRRRSARRWSRPAPKLGEYRELIDGWLIADQLAPRKQRHTAKRIWRRLRRRSRREVAETTVRDHVRKRRRALGLTVGEVFVPQVHAPARTAEVDWGEAEVDLAGARATGALVSHAVVFLGRGVLRGLAGRDAAGVLGRARAGVRLVRRRASRGSDTTILGRRSRRCSRAAVRVETRPVRRVALALSVRLDLHHAGD